MGKKLTDEEIKMYIEENGYTLVFLYREKREYNGNRKLRNIVVIEVICPLGHTFKIDFSKFKSKENKCSVCGRIRSNNAKKLSYEYVKEYIEKDNYKLLSTKYENNRTKLSVKCDKEHEYKVTFNDFQNGYRCPYCNNSKGEKRVLEILNKLNIDCIPQYRFKDCKFKNTLPFDFYLPKYNICIEFDGEQHYKIKECFGGLDEFINIKIRDTIKNEYCKNNNIKLIRIPYWEFDGIENIITNIKYE